MEKFKLLCVYFVSVDHRLYITVKKNILQI